MRGRIGVQSEPGRGSTFSVRLPLPSVLPAQDAPTSANAQLSAPLPPTRAVTAHKSTIDPPLAASEARPRLLLVEDDVTAGQAIAGLIETFGYKVTLAAQALAALEEIDGGEAFDAMVLDFDLPGMDGCELATLLRQRGDTTPIIALTASAHGDEERRAFDAGMNAFLRKPVLPEPLREVLDSVFEKTPS